MRNKIKCWLGLHHWKTCIGKGAENMYPPCRDCGAVYHLTQGQVNRWWELQNQIARLKKEQRDLGK